MKKKVILVLVLSGLLSLGLLAKLREEPEERPATPISTRDLLQAHHVPRNLDVLSVFVAEAERTTSYAVGPHSELPGSFKRNVTVARYGQVFKYSRADMMGLTKQFDLFDGSATHHAVTAKGNLVEESNQPGDSPSEAVAFEIKTFGLLPILRQLADPKTESVYVGRTAQRWEELQVKTPTKTWTVYADSDHLIRRVEFRDNIIDYEDYRVVDGVWLPFAQRFFLGGRLYYELSFNKIDLKPKFPSDYFSHEAFLKEIAR